MGIERSAADFVRFEIGAGRVCWEIDNDQLAAPLNDGEWESELAKALTDLAEMYEDSELLCATYGAESMSFGRLDYSVWITCIGSPPMMKACADLIAEIVPAHQRRKGLTTLGQYWNERIRLADGKVWRPVDAGTWEELANEDASSGESVDAETEIDIPIWEDLDDDKPPMNAVLPTRRRRTNAAHSDVKIGYYLKKIEKQLKLPEGSVRFVNPDGSFPNANLLVGTLRRRWEE